MLTLTCKLIPKFIKRTEIGIFESCKFSLYLWNAFTVLEFLQLSHFINNHCINNI